MTETTETETTEGREHRNTLGILSLHPTEIASEFGLTERQAAFTLKCVQNGGIRSRAYAEVYDNYFEVPTPDQRVAGSKLFSKSNVKAAYRSILARLHSDLGEIAISKEKIVRDLEAVKIAAFQRVDDVQNPGSMLNAAVRATELQGRELGMFAQRHRHEHEHSLVPPGELVERLRRANPVLASAIASHLGLEIIEGECSERDTDEPEELIHKTSD